MDEKRIARFWSRVDKRGPVPKHARRLGRCWIWLGKPQGGYGVFNDGTKNQKAHRVSWYLATGAWPSPCALHKCDNGLCVNPKHLFEGTRRDNNRDRSEKGRNGTWDMRGERGPGAKLTETDAREIIRLGFSGTPPTQLARMFGGSQQNIGAILDGRSWVHLSRPVDQSGRVRHRKLTDSNVNSIRSSAEPGRVLAKRFGVSEGTVSNIRHGRARV